MKLVRFGEKGEERPGLIDATGLLRDLSGFATDVTADLFLPGYREKLSCIRADRLPLVAGTPRLGVPLSGIGKIVAIGLNYSDHAAESGMSIPQEPIVFMKAVSALNGPNDQVVLPRGSVKTDWEVELAVVIGKSARYVTETRAIDHVAGYTICNDISERAYQLERGGTWDKGKGCDTFAPVGPWLVTSDEISDPQNLDLWLDVNGQRMQTGNTRTMIFGVARLVSYVSHFMTLEAGDVLITGTPPGVGLGRKPQVFLKEGDTMKLGITGLGHQVQRCIVA